MVTNEELTKKLELEADSVAKELTGDLVQRLEQISGKLVEIRAHIFDPNKRYDPRIKDVEATFYSLYERPVRVTPCEHEEINRWDEHDLRIYQQYKKLIEDLLGDYKSLLEIFPKIKSENKRLDEKCRKERLKPGSLKQDTPYETISVLPQGIYFERISPRIHTPLKLANVEYLEKK